MRDYIYIKKDEKSMALYNSAETCLNDRIKAVGKKEGFPWGPCGDYDYFLLETHCNRVGLTPVDKFEGLTLFFHNGSLRMVDAPVVGVTPGNISAYGSVHF